MHLVYIDESGNTGKNLVDPQQPVFLLCAMLVHISRWQQLETGLQQVCNETLGTRSSQDGFEIHAADIRNGGGVFRGISVTDRIDFRDKLLQKAVDADVKLIYRSIEKHRFKKWITFKC